MEHRLAVQVSGLTASVGTGASAVTPLRGVDLVIDTGDSVAVCGVSGSGKTTLLRILAAELEPVSGSIMIDGRSPADCVARGEVSTVYQDYRLVPFLTAVENVAFALEVRGLDARSAATAALEALQKVGLAGLEGRLPHELSGGQQQRVGIARALVVRPKIILADEPTAALDAGTAAEVMAVLREQVRSAGACLLVATHDPLVAGAVTKRYQLIGGVLQHAA